VFGFGKRKCKECGGALAEMEALRDRADDLMKSSALGTAESLADICAACRVKLTKSTQSLAMNLHVIEARRVEAEAKVAEAPPAERQIAQIVEAAPDENKLSYEPGEGFKAISELPDIADEGSTKFADVKDVGTFLKWLFTTTEGRGAGWGAFAALIALSLNMCSTDNSGDPVDYPVAAEEPPSNPQPSQPEAEPIPEPSAAPIPTAFARPANNPGSWVTTNDYPSRALGDGREGTTSFLLTVNAQGGVTDCAVTQSSGHTDLDEAACSALSRRARFERAPVGTPDRGYRNRVSWRIPKE
jgi:TonB family protein